MEEKKLLLKFYKVVDILGRIVIPAQVRKKFGDEYYLEVYEDYVKLIPAKKKE